MQVRDDGDLDQIYEVPIMVANYEYVQKLVSTKFAEKLNGKCVVKEKKPKKYSKVLD